MIAVEGPIAAGKTTLARRLAGRLGTELVLEPVEENPFLRRFYEDRLALAFRTQLFFLVNRFHQQRRVGELLAAGRDVVTDYLFHKDRLFARLNLSGEELALYEEVYGLIEPRAPRPDLLVLLRCDVGTLMVRVRERGREFEYALSRDYMARLVAAYEGFAKEVRPARLLVVDAAEEDLEAEVRRVEEALRDVDSSP